MVMGRPNKGVHHIDGCDGSELSKQRTKLILETITGERSVQSACDELGIQRARFAELRIKALQGAVDALEPGRPGRPRVHDPEQEQHDRELDAHIRTLERLLLISETKGLLSELRADEKGGVRSKWGWGRG